ncbi:MAG TPA: hypothetical protein VIE18_03575 [Gaiellaceae bacterium]
MGRRLAILLAACLAVPALAFAGAGAGEPKKRIAPADQKKAAAIVLKRADLAANWKRIHTSDGGDDLRCPGFAPDESDLTLTGESETEFEYTGGMPYLGSFSNVYVSTKDALASWTRSVKPAVAGCVAHFFRQGVAAEGGKVTILKQGKIAFPLVAPRTAAFHVLARVTLTNAGKSVTIPFAIHLIALGRGRADVGLIAMGPGTGIPTRDLREFARVLSLRLKQSGL